ncbi:MAG: hypothetical protein WC531_02440 [Candidatus Paceibacterota bacterium]|jgi:NADH:ubiquinone oxidoreductase subunit H
MEQENQTGIAIAVAIIVIILFFGGWYLFFGQTLTQPANLEPVTAPVAI